MSAPLTEAKSLFSAIREYYKNGSALNAEQTMVTLEKVFLELQVENLNLRLELRAAQESLQERDTMIYEAPFYYRFDGENKSGPFCQKCYDVDNKKVRLIEHAFREGTHRCNVCESYYGPPRETGHVRHLARYPAIKN